MIFSGAKEVTLKMQAVLNANNSGEIYLLWPAMLVFFCTEVYWLKSTDSSTVSSLSIKKARRNLSFGNPQHIIIYNVAIS